MKARGVSQGALPSFVARNVSEGDKILPEKHRMHKKENADFRRKENKNSKKVLEPYSFLLFLRQKNLNPFLCLL